MTYYDTKTITCPNCGRRFTWSAKEQKHFNRIGYEDRKYCDLCRARRKDYFRSSQVDHPAYPPPASLPMEPDEALTSLSAPKPTGEKRPFTQPDPVKQLTIVLWLLVILAFLVFTLLLTLLF